MFVWWYTEVTKRVAPSLYPAWYAASESNQPESVQSIYPNLSFTWHDACSYTKNPIRKRSLESHWNRISWVIWLRGVRGCSVLCHCSLVLTAGLLAEACRPSHSQRSLSLSLSVSPFLSVGSLLRGQAIDRANAQELAPPQEASAAVTSEHYRSPHSAPLAVRPTGSAQSMVIIECAGASSSTTSASCRAQ